LNTYAYGRNHPGKWADRYGLDTTVIIIYDSSGIGSYTGSHAAVHIDNGGYAVLYDPAGSYQVQIPGGGTYRPSGDAFYGEEANSDSYEEYHEADGGTVVEITIPTSAELEQIIADNIDAMGGAPMGGFCAWNVSTVLAGSGGPFGGLNQTFLPSSIQSQLQSPPAQNSCDACSSDPMGMP
jgi:hypothetical protein